ncbi:MAG TPA: VOC family protein [Candidatus Stackebrandtia faecavium]|nr:VOC family protein [Candidatus Stackebrandtia faecavium]
MELLCTMYPVEDLEAAAAFYLELGFKDIARPDVDTALMASPASNYVEIMLERHPVEMEAGSGPVFKVPDVATFHTEHPDLDWRFAPIDLPNGKYALFCDSQGNPVRLADFRNDSGRYARLFRPRND